MVSKNPISCFHFDNYQLDALHCGLPQNDPLKEMREKKKKKLSFACISRSLQALKELGVIWACVTKVLGVGPILPLTHFHHFPDHSTCSEVSNQRTSEYNTSEFWDKCLAGELMTIDILLIFVLYMRSLL